MPARRIGFESGPCPILLASHVAPELPEHGRWLSTEPLGYLTNRFATLDTGEDLLSLTE
jgi:hypothetical protein